MKSRMARDMLARLHRESLHRPNDEELGELVDRILAFPGVDPGWRTPDFTQVELPVFSVRLARDDLRVAFLTTLTGFSAPQNVTLEELRIEAYFPLDDATAEVCRNL